ncbi:hypothetical protein J6590_051221 [Homalodisca vitripennis]|nr:hypothetical protein J6590_051221 [Homalodisca vitripennis]
MTSNQDASIFQLKPAIMFQFLLMKNSLLRKVLPFQTGLIGSALIMFGILTISTSYQNASTFQLRLVIICWFLFTLLFTTALTSSIVTRLTLPLYTRRVDSVQQLVEGGYYWTQPDYHNRRATLSEFYFDLHLVASFGRMHTKFQPDL